MLSRYFIINPVTSDVPLSLLYKTFYIFKKVYNNWLKLKNTIFKYPDFNNYNDVKTSYLNHLRNMYNKKEDFLLKYAHTMNYTA